MRATLGYGYRLGWGLALLLLAATAGAAQRSVMAPQSAVEFTVRQMGVPITGRFSRFEATLDFDQRQTDKSSARIQITIASLDTGNEEADAIAVGADWLDKARWPTALFQSSAIRAVAPGRLEARGSLSIHGIERALTVPISVVEQADARTLLQAEFPISRSAFQIGRGVWNQSGVVSDEIQIKVRLMLAAPAR